MFKDKHIMYNNKDILKCKLDGKIFLNLDKKKLLNYLMKERILFNNDNNNKRYFFKYKNRGAFITFSFGPSKHY